MYQTLQQTLLIYILLDQAERTYGPWTDLSTCEGIGEDTSCGEGRKIQVRTCSPGTQQACPREKDEQSVECQLTECPGIF